MSICLRKLVATIRFSGVLSSRTLLNYHTTEVVNNISLTRTAQQSPHLVSQTTSDFFSPNYNLKYIYFYGTAEKKLNQEDLLANIGYYHPKTLVLHSSSPLPKHAEPAAPQLPNTVQMVCQKVAFIF